MITTLRKNTRPNYGKFPTRELTLSEKYAQAQAHERTLRENHIRADAYNEGFRKGVLATLVPWAASLFLLFCLIKFL